jgi:hypothetical protein
LYSLVYDEMERKYVLFRPYHGKLRTEQRKSRGTL